MNPSGGWQEERVSLVRLNLKSKIIKSKII